MSGENVAKMGRGTGTVDRISELPEFILHKMLLKLDTKEAGRVSVVSKRWYEAWSSFPVLKFQLQDYKKEYWDRSEECDFSGFSVDDDVIQSYLGFIDRVMQRYDTQNFRIRKLHLELPTVDKKTEPLVDKWIRIAVQNKVTELIIEIITPYPQLTSNYRLPEILFRAKSLKGLHCTNVVLPYYETIELISLKYLTLFLETVDTNLLQRILFFCPLVEFITTSDLGKISLPWPANVKQCGEFINSEVIQSQFKASPLRLFEYCGVDGVVTWPLNMNLAALKNLRELEIASATITDDNVSELAYGLVALESLLLDSCSMLKCIMISSISLKELRIVKGFNLMKVTVDTPNLIEFGYNCEMETSLSVIRVSDHCNAQFSPLMTESITAYWLVKLMKILKETNFFQFLVIGLSHSLEIAPIAVVEGQLRNVVTGPPYKLRELKLHKSHILDCIEFPLMALEGLFWICHPDTLSITSSQEFSAEAILDMLKFKVQCGKYPLKSIEVQGIDRSGLLLSYSPQIEYTFRLSWLEI